VTDRRRGRGEGGLYWDPQRKRWEATVSLGYDAAGKRKARKVRGRTKTEAQMKLREALRARDAGEVVESGTYTVGEAVKDWLDYGNMASESTSSTNRRLAEKHIVPLLGARRLRDLTAEEVDRWLADRAKRLSTSSLSKLHSILNRAVRRAMARDKLKRNVVELCEIPPGRPGRPSKALTLGQARAVLATAELTRLGPYVTVSLLTGARTEELRALTWDHVDLVGQPDVSPPVPPHVAVWRSVRAGGETKTRKSRRTLALPARAVDALRRQAAAQDSMRRAAGDRWHEAGLVFTTRFGTALDAADVRRDFRAAIADAPGVDAAEWTPRELRHSFVSLLSDDGVPIEDISRLVGHKSSAVTELIYRKQIRPVLQSGATAMDRILGS
jgi:integrase